jgi:hypothetical protein
MAVARPRSRKFQKSERAPPEFVRASARRNVKTGNGKRGYCNERAEPKTPDRSRQESSVALL